MVAQETFVSNGAESTLSSSLSSGATTINVTSTAAFPSVPFYAVIDPDVDASREVILVDGSKTATTFVLSGASKRGQDGTTDTTHSSGAKIVCVPVAALWTDINDRVDAANTTATAAYTPGGADVAVADGGTGASTAAAARTNLGAVGNVGGDTITASGAAVKPLVVKGAASQTANLQEWQNSAGTVLARMQSGGTFRTSQSLVADDVVYAGGDISWFGGQMQVQPAAATRQGLVVRGAASQTANLQEWQNSAGTVLTAVRADGHLDVATTTRTTGLDAGVAQALPVPEGYMAIYINGFLRYLPYYSAA